MAEQIAVVTKTIPASTGTQDFTDPSITEDFSAAILIFSASDSDGTDNAGAILGVGFLSDEHDVSVLGDVSACWFAQNGQNTSPNTGFRNSTNRCVSVVNTTGTGSLIVGAVYVSAIPGGFQLNFTTASQACKVTAIILAGLPRASADTCAVAASSGSEPVGATTYEPDVLVMMGTDQAAGVDFSANLVGAAPTMGFALNEPGTPQVMAMVSADDAAEPSDCDGALRSNRAVGEISTARVFSAGTITFTSSGFDHVSDGGPFNARYLALQFTPNRVRQGCANLAVAASTGVQSWSDLGIGVPDLLFGMGTLLAAEDAALEDGANAGAVCFFVTGRFGSRAWTWHTQEGLTLAGATVANSHTRQEDVALLMYDHLGNVVWRADWVGGAGVPGGSFGLDFSVADQAGFLTVWGLQLIPAPDVFRRPRRAVRPRRTLRPRRHLGLTRAPDVVGATLAPHVLRLWARYRREARRRLWPRRIAPITGVLVPREPLELDPGLQYGDNALAGSYKGTTALAGSSAGDSA